MFSTLLMGGGGQAREKDHQNVKSLIIFARDCRLLHFRTVQVLHYETSQAFSIISPSLVQVLSDK
jgi:hypothetical protein